MAAEYETVDVTAFLYENISEKMRFDEQIATNLKHSQQNSSKIFKKCNRAPKNKSTTCQDAAKTCARNLQK